MNMFSRDIIRTCNFLYISQFPCTWTRAKLEFLLLNFYLHYSKLKVYQTFNPAVNIGCRLIKSG